ncbi:MAG: DegV family protein [Asgard group archaeon]|nr:DegV family protein [Asgard group archaeon]
MANQKVRVLSDGTIDLPKKVVEEMNIGILPTQIIMEDRDKPYKNYIDITPDEFFEKLLNCKEIPTTSVPRQGDVFKVYEQSLKDYDSLIVFGHSSKISSSYALAKKVAEQMFPEQDITVIDSETITVMEGLLVYEAAKMAQNGATKEEIISRTNELIPHAHGFGVIKTLDYLRKGGRISIAKHLIGKMANFKPIVTVEDGLVKNLGKVRGYDNALDLIKKNLPKFLAGRKTDKVIIFHALMPESAGEIRDAILTLDKNIPSDLSITQLGPVLGTHLGPYRVGLGWIGRWDRKWFAS